MIKGDALILEFFMNCIPISFLGGLLVELVIVIVCVSLLFHRCCLGMCAAWAPLRDGVTTHGQSGTNRPPAAGRGCGSWVTGLI